MRKLIIGLFLIFLITSSCKELLETDWTFENASSYNVTVTPGPGESWTEFTLSPGSSKTITTESNAISFYYSPALQVTYDQNDTTIRFRNL